MTLVWHYSPAPSRHTPKTLGTMERQMHRAAHDRAFGPHTTPPKVSNLTMNAGDERMGTEVFEELWQ